MQRWPRSYKIYYDPERGLGSIDKLCRAARAEAPEGVKITREQMKEWLEKQPVHQRFRKVTIVYNPIVGNPGGDQLDQPLRMGESATRQED